MLDIVCCLPMNMKLIHSGSAFVDLFFCIKDEPRAADTQPCTGESFWAAHKPATIQAWSPDTAHVGYLPLELSSLPEVAKEACSP